MHKGSSIVLEFNLVPKYHFGSQHLRNCLFAVALAISWLKWS